MFSGLSAFLAAFRNRWLSLMSGSASVPFAIGAVFFNDWQQILCLIAAGCFFFFASFLVWKAERDRADGLAMQFVPKLGVTESPRLWLGQEANAAGALHTRHYVQVLVSATASVAVVDCHAHLTRISKLTGDGRWEEIFRDNLLCLWSMLDKETVTLSPGVPQYLNIASARENQGNTRLRPELQALPNALAARIADPGVYKFELSITGRDVAVPCRLSIKVDTLIPGAQNMRTE